MDVQAIKSEIEWLKTHGETAYGNCEKLGFFEKAKRSLAKPSTAVSRETHPECSMTMMEAEAWISGMKNADGTTGAQFCPDRTGGEDFCASAQMASA